MRKPFNFPSKSIILCFQALIGGCEFADVSLSSLQGALEADYFRLSIDELAEVRLDFTSQAPHFFLKRLVCTSDFLEEFGAKRRQELAMHRWGAPEYPGGALKSPSTQDPSSWLAYASRQGRRESSGVPLW